MWLVINWKDEQYEFINSLRELRDFLLTSNTEYGRVSVIEVGYPQQAITGKQLKEFVLSIK